MTVNKVPKTTSLIIEIENGTDNSGNTVYKKKSFSGVKSTATSSDVMEVALAIKGIISVGIRDILLSETSMLLKEAE